MKANLYFDFVSCEYCKKEFCCSDADIIFEKPEEKEEIEKLNNWLTSMPNPFDRMFYL
jgi:hypothetical protein